MAELQAENPEYSPTADSNAQDARNSNQKSVAKESQPVTSRANSAAGFTALNAPISAQPTLESGNSILTAAVSSASTPATPAIVAGTVSLGMNQAARHVGESFTLHPTDPTKILAHFRIEIPHQPGEFYEQIDTIPMYDKAATSPPNPSFYFVPNLTNSKVEKKIRKSKQNAGQPDLWVRQPKSNTWTRKDPKGGPDHVFELKVMFRRFNMTTHKYEEIYLNLRMLKNADPNKKTWMYAYNKWIDQIRRRRDGTHTQTVHKSHWSVAERRALCDAINAYIRREGLCRFGSGANVQISQAEIQVMADAVNNEGGMQRRPDAVRSQIFSAHAKKNKAILDTLDLAKSLRTRLENGEVIPHAEQYPFEAIPRPAFPKDLTPTSGRTDAHRGRGKNASSKKRSTSAMDSETDSNFSDIPADLYSPKRVANTPLLAFMRDFSKSRRAGGLRPSKKIKFATDSGNELSSDDQWAETDEESLSENAEREREEAQWQSLDGGCISKDSSGSESGDDSEL